MAHLVYINTIPRDTVTKVSEFRNVGARGQAGRKMNKTKIFDHCKDGLSALYSPSVGGLKTGLYKKIRTEDKEITLQEWAETKWGLDRGTLTNRPFRKGDSPKDEDMTYFQKKSWKLNDGLTVLDLHKLDDWCFYQICLESKFIANSEKEWRSHKWPKATHYIALENESEEIKYKKNYSKSKAFAQLHDEDFTLAWKRKFISLLGLGNTRNEYSEENIHNMLMKMIMDSTNTKMGLSDIEVFSDYFLKLKDSEGRERLESEYLLNQLLDYNIVSEKYGTYKWKAQGLDIGYKKSEAIDFLLDPKKQGQVEDLEKELNIKKG
jgi:hypothetical protein